MTPGGLLLVGGLLCLDFCNTISERLADQPQDILAGQRYKALVHWSHDIGLIAAHTAARLNALDDAQTEAVFAAAVRLRDALYRLAMAAKDHEAVPVDALDTLNFWQQQAAQQRELAMQESGQYGWRWRVADAPEVMLWEVTLSAVDMLVQADASRLRQCPGCGWLFYDGSRNNSRMWCDMRYCGNRAKNRRFHQRQKSD